MTSKNAASVKSARVENKANVVPIESASAITKLIQQYGCGPVQFSGSNDALYERHLIFDNVVSSTAATSRMRYEAAAQAIRASTGHGTARRSRRNRRTKRQA